jgi:hypothetical protein
MTVSLSVDEKDVGGVLIERARTVAATVGRRYAASVDVAR